MSSDSSAPKVLTCLNGLLSASRLRTYKCWGFQCTNCALGCRRQELSLIGVDVGLAGIKPLALDHVSTINSKLS